MSDNMAGGIAYITIVPAILFLIMAPYNRRSFVRFHSFQCLLLALVSIVSNVLHIIPFFGTILMMMVNLVIFVLWLVAMIQAFQGRKFLIPLIGPMAEQAAANG